MKTIRVIDLLNKIANGEDIPKKIKVYNNGTIYEYDDGIDYKTKDGRCLFDTYLCITKEDLNMKLEIIEDTQEDKKLPEKIEEPRFNNGRYYIKDINGDDTEITGIERTLRLKINGIIDYLKRKGDK